jgi:hypothetical protein
VLTPVDLATVLLSAVLNPAVVIVALWMGANADQWQKVPVAAFAAALVGSALIYLAVRLGVPGVSGVGRAAAGVFAAEFICGVVWATLGYCFLRRRAS